ncbi:hypothetical protein PBI_HILLTOPFARM_96 [Mycobacterium phage Hilltopfarm]|nr:hypothetical protein PBI_HILLTOPFARM_96 [Mycobacterium phage Hilltopfarm]
MTAKGKHRSRRRGWRYRGGHHTRRGALTVADIKKSLRPNDGQMIHLGSVIKNVTFFGLPPDADPSMVEATLTLVGDEPTLTIAALTGPPGPGAGS